MTKFNNLTRKGFILSLASISAFFWGCFRANSPSSVVIDNKDKDDRKTSNSNLKGRILEPINGGASVIYNPNGTKIVRMDIDISALNRFELTDKSWDSYQKAGNIKKWKIDNGKWKEEPLKNISVSEKLTGKTLNIKVGFFKPSWQNIETEVFQTIVLLP